MQYYTLSQKQILHITADIQLKMNSLHNNSRFIHILKLTIICNKKRMPRCWDQIS